MKLSVIVPAYNEARHITMNIRALDASLAKLDMPYQIIVVDDASQDQTLPAARRAATGRSNVVVTSCPAHGGKGLALQHGFSKADGDIVGFIDADMDLHPRQVGILLKQFEQAKADIAVGSKTHPRSRVDYPWFRRFLSLGYRLLTRMLFNLTVRDTQVGLKLFNRAVLEEVMPRLVVKRFAFDVELLAVASHYGYTKVIEVPITLDYHFSSTVRWSDIRNMLQDTLGIFYRLRIKRYYQQQRPEPAVTIVREGTQLSELETSPIARWHSRLRRLRR